MNQQELNRLRRRCERFLEILEHNYPNVVLRNEIRLINEASENLCKEMDGYNLYYSIEYPYSFTSIEYPDFYNINTCSYTITSNLDSSSKEED